MTTVQSEVYLAFRAIDIPEDKALLAAIALSKRDADIDALRSDLRLITWMVGALTALVVATGGPPSWLLLRMAAKLGAIT